MYRVFNERTQYPLTAAAAAHNTFYLHFDWHFICTTNGPQLVLYWKDKGAVLHPFRIAGAYFVWLCFRF